MSEFEALGQIDDRKTAKGAPFVSSDMETAKGAPFISADIETDAALELNSDGGNFAGNVTGDDLLTAARRIESVQGYSEDLRRRLGIRYVQLHFELEMLEDGRLPVYKSSALRGGMGDMLLNAYCFCDRLCERCGFEDECTVRRIMYAKYPERPESVTSGESIGYQVLCEDYREKVWAGYILRFTVTLFGRLIVYLNPILQAFSMLGKNGLGKEKVHFGIRRVLNARNQVLFEGSWVYQEQYRVETLADYVDYRLRKLSEGGYPAREGLSLKVTTPVALKHNGEILNYLDLEVLTDALVRRIYMLDMFEGIAGYGERDFKAPIGRVLRETPTVIPRFSSTHNRQVKLRGVRGEFEIEEISKEALAVLLAGEVIHAGKNISMGFGKVLLLTHRTP